MNAIESQLNQNLYGGYSDKSFFDKVIAKEEVNEMKRIMEKDDWDRTDFSKILYLMNANELKLINFDKEGWERYVLGKYYTWIRELVLMAQILFDYQSKEQAGELTLLDESKILINDYRRTLEHNCKFCIDIFFFISRSTLGKEGHGFDTAMTSRFEYKYNQPEIMMPQAQSQNLFSRITGRGRQQGEQ